MKCSIISLLLLSVITSQMSLAENKTQATALIKAMRASESALLGMRLSTEIGVSKGQASNELLNCLNNSDKDSFVDIYAMIISDNLSDEEIIAALKFYDSSAGIKYTSVGFISVRKSVGIKEDIPLPSFTKNEENIVVEFMATPAAEKLWKQNLLGSSDSQEKVNPHLKKLYDSCK